MTTCTCYLCWMQPVILLQLPMARPSWTHMSSQRGFRIGASCQTSFGACLMASSPTFLWQAMRLVSRHLFIVARAAARLPIYNFIAICAALTIPFLCAFVLFIIFIQDPSIFWFNAYYSQIEYQRSCDRKKMSKLNRIRFLFNFAIFYDFNQLSPFYENRFL